MIPYDIYNAANVALHKKGSEIPYTGNPLRFYTIQKAITDIEQFENGVFAPVVLAFDSISKHDSLIPILIEKRCAALESMDYQVKTINDTPEAKAQQLAVEEYLNGFDNLQQTFSEMEMASFHGLSFHEKLIDKGIVVGLNHIPIEFISRKGTSYYYNPMGAFGQGIGELIDPTTVIMRKTHYPIAPALNILYTRKYEGQVNHDEFIENYSIPSTFVIAPENTPPEKHSEFVEAAKNVISNSRGVLPYGSNVTQVKTTEDNNTVFITYLDKIDQEIVIRCTGGLLTTLSLPQGIGSGSTDAHADSFNTIIAGDAANISEIITTELVNPFLAKMYPNQEPQVYFKLDLVDEKTVKANIIELKKAGFEVDESFVEEKFGVKLKKSSAQ